MNVCQALTHWEAGWAYFNSSSARIGLDPHSAIGPACVCVAMRVSALHSGRVIGGGDAKKCHADLFCGHSRCACGWNQVQKDTPQSVPGAFRVLLGPKSSADLQNFAAV